MTLGHELPEFLEYKKGSDPTEQKNQVKDNLLVSEQIK